ncbi:nitrilase-related carbon-nitrogen hydrolase [Streptosporangium sp. NPDC004379]|uniref:nitrilase-related carbon-nitrogen hydrolase n=1 Tax=Streptosporangium sp. NPDC004379 TaxID=3366189 RepID=UPI003683FB28
MNTVTLGAVQLRSAHGDVAANLEAIEDLTAAAAAVGARVVVTPEMALTGYLWSSEEHVRPFAEPVDGPSVRRLTRLCRTTGAWLVLGMPELDPDLGTLHNTCVLIGPDGPAGSYRKAQAFVADPLWAVDGHLPPPVWDTPAGRVTPLICADADYPEPARYAALRGADWIALPTAWVAEPGPSATWRLRAWENGLPLVAADQAGAETLAGNSFQFSGGSCVLDHTGAVAAALDDGSGFVVATLDLDAAAAARHRRLAARRPAEYGPLARSTVWPRADREALTTPPGGVPSSGGAFSPGGASSVETETETETETVSRTGTVFETWDTTGAGAGEGRTVGVAVLAGPAGDLPAPPEGTDLAVLPAFHLTGGVPDPGRARPALEELRAWCERHRCEAVTALAVPGDDERGAEIARGTEIADDPGGADGPRGPVRYAVTLVTPGGEAARRHVTHLGAHAAWAEPGDEPPMAVTRPWGSLGLLAGEELEPFEPSRVLAVLGADILAVPAAVDWPYPVPFPGTRVPLNPAVLRDPEPAFAHPARLRAGDSHIWIALANAGVTPGGVFGPDHVTVPREEALNTGIGWTRLRCAVRGTNGAGETCAVKPQLARRRTDLFGAEMLRRPR